MAATEAEIEALALGLMRAWVACDDKALKKLVARDAMVMVGSLPPQLLDRPSFLAAVDRGFACTRFTLREVFVRRQGKCAWFVAGAELELAFDTKLWAGPFLITDLWRKGTIGGWKLAERSLAPLDKDGELASRVAKLQLWNKP